MRRRYAGKGYRRRMPMVRSMRVNDYAGVSESIPFQAQAPLIAPTTSFFTLNAPGVVYRNVDMTLGLFPRAQLVAQGYQYFRVKYLELKILPSVDTFTGGTQVKPFFYYMLDKGNTLPPGLTSTQLKSLGAKPIALDENPITIRWKPGVSLSTEISTTTGATSAQRYQLSPWLNVDENPNDGTFNPSLVVHNGIKFFAENVGGVNYNYSATLTAHIEFKKPAIPAVSG